MAEAKGQIHVLDTLVDEGNADFNKGLETSYLEINDTKDKGTDGGGFTQGEYRTRDLTETVHDTLADSVSLGSNQFVVPSGTYRIEASVPAFRVDGHVGRLADVTDNSGAQGITIVQGTVEHSGAEFYPTQTRSIIEGRFVVTRPTTMEIQHYCETTRGTDGFGARTNFYNTDEVYTDVKMWQIIAT